MRRTVPIVLVVLALVATTACGGGGGGGGTASGSAPGGTSGGTTGGTTGGVGQRVSVRFTGVGSSTHDHAAGDTETYLIDGTYPTVHALTLPLFPDTVRFVFDDTQTAELGNGPNDERSWHFTDAAHLGGGAIDPNFDAHGHRVSSDNYSISADVLPFADPGHVGFYRAQVISVPTPGSTGISTGDEGWVIVGQSGYASLVGLDIAEIDEPLWLAQSASTWVGQASSYSAVDHFVTSETLTLNAGVTAGSYRRHHQGSAHADITDAEIAFSLTPATLPSAHGHRGTHLANGTAPGYVGSSSYVTARYPTAGAAVTATVHAEQMTVTVASGSVSETFAIDSAWYDSAAGEYTVTALRDDTDASLTTAHKQVIEAVELVYTADGGFHSGAITWSLPFDPTPDQEEDPTSGTPNDTLLGGVDLAP